MHVMTKATGSSPILYLARYTEKVTKSRNTSRMSISRMVVGVQVTSNMSVRMYALTHMLHAAAKAYEKAHPYVIVKIYHVLGANNNVPERDLYVTLRDANRGTFEVVRCDPDTPSEAFTELLDAALIPLRCRVGPGAGRPS